MRALSGAFVKYVSVVVAIHIMEKYNAQGEIYRMGRGAKSAPVAMSEFFSCSTRKSRPWGRAWSPLPTGELYRRAQFY